MADAFDSMTAGRPYKRPMTEQEIIAELRDGSGTQFDPLLVDRFVNALEKEPDFRRRISMIYRRKDQESRSSGLFS